ncbi:site-specific DNA-methyltransferase [Aeromonas veronii]|uniref:site-specific DNA-methyltransferase n=1 Tax=Aeromonas veronii TaxID=654 RepID=UPI003BA2E36A
MSKNTPAQESLQLATPDGGTTNVEKYEFEPIKGYPVLNWRGKRPFTSTQYYPAQLKEIHGEEVDGWRNKIFWGDNLQVMSHLLKGFRGKVDLVYIDPPYDSKADYKKKIKSCGEEASADTSFFEEKQYGDIWTNDEYLQYVYERVVLLKELLSETGVLVLHCDWHRNAHIRLVLDEIFGASNLINEIVWHYKTFQGQTRGYFAKKHDTLLIYRKGAKYTFHQLFDTALEDTIDAKRWAAYIDDEGVIRGANMPIQDSRFIRYLDKWKKASGREPGPEDVVYQVKGQPIDSVWDLKGLDPKSEEKTGYPTQKPEELLDRVISSLSNPGSLVLDVFMGSGTTQAVAMKLGRRFIGADINLGAIQTSTKRLIGAGHELRQKMLDADTKTFTGFEIYNVNHYDIFRNPVQAKELLIEALEVQKLEFSTVFDGEKDGRMVKIMPINRIATRADLNELIAGFDYKAWERKQNESPNRPVEKLTLVCMGHEPDLAAQLELAAKPFKIDVEVVDILRDKADLEFKRDSQAKVVIKKDELVIERFYPMNLLQKLSLQTESVEDWKELVESVLIDWNYDGAVLQPTVVDIPGKNEMVKGIYKVPDDAGSIRVKITDLLSESWEGDVTHG